MAQRYRYGTLEWPVRTLHHTEIDGKTMRAVTSSWYTEESKVTNWDEEEEVQMQPRDPNILTVEEITKQTAELRKKKRGSVTHYCPYCPHKNVGRRDNIIRHVKTCNERRKAGEDMNEAPLKEITSK